MRSMFADLAHDPVPDWLITEDFEDHILGEVKTGKEGRVWLVERVGVSGSCLLALKRYKTETETTFRRDQTYLEGKKIRESRVRRAVERGTAFGKAVSRGRWQGAEYDNLMHLWRLGLPVPYPVEMLGGLLMQFIGDHERAAPRLVDARLSSDEASEAWEQVHDTLLKMCGAGLIHGDLSAYNLLWWDGRIWVIDVPQMVEIAINPHAFDLLERDVRNLCAFFGRRGVAVDPGEVMAEIVGVMF